jgi:hypothetical protein
MKKKRAVTDRDPDRTFDKMWTVHVEQDAATGDLILPLPEDLLAMQGWATGDTLVWDEGKDGAWMLSKKETDMKTKDQKDRFDLEQEIMQCWNVVEDLRILADRNPAIAEDLKAVAHVYEMRFDNMFNTFEVLIKNGNLS